MTPTSGSSGRLPVAGEYAPTLANNQKPLRRRKSDLSLMVKNHFISAQRALSSHKLQLPGCSVNGPIEAPAGLENCPR